MVDVVPDDVAVQVAAAGEEDPAPGRFGQPIGELHIFAGLRPTGQQEDVDRDPLAVAEQPFAQGGLLGARMRRIEQVQQLPSKWAVGRPSVIRMICRLGVSWAVRNLRASCRACWILVKCGGM